ncbi:MAG TPA: methionine--tRNA ligase [Nevskiales bacterium]|nr:methionine--tRNA ligase [Nevskiales bacterium]
MSGPKRKIFVTNALPYANGPIHLGHLVGYIQADIWVRFQRMQGHDVTYVCADDAHGTPIMLKAEADGVTPEQLIARVLDEHRRDFRDFGVAFDNYHTTHSPENKELSELFYTLLDQAGHIERHTIEQLYDPVKAMFLPDRYIKGECPKCGAKDQYGDACENCAATYSPTDLKNPYSVVSGARPVLRPSEHYFFKLSRFADQLAAWIESGRLHPAVANKLREWLDSGLRDWDISRDAPYFGFEIPGAPGKYLYVWLDAPIGYLASLKNLYDRQGKDWREFWDAGSDTEVWHFIGKDIVNFHGLMWPAMLKGAGLRQPTGLSVNGYLTVNGEKMSKSRGTFIRAETYLRHLNPECLRYYYAAKLSDGVDDIDLNLDDFVARVNSDLIGKYVNIASRAASFINRHFDHRLSALSGSTARPCTTLLWAEEDSFRDAYEARDFARVVREAMRLADFINATWDERKPWLLAKDPAQHGRLQDVCTDTLCAFYVLTLYLAPVLPATARKALALFGIEEPASFQLVKRLPRRISAYEHLMARIDPAAVKAMVEESKEDMKPMSAQAPPPQASPIKREGEKAKSPPPLAGKGVKEKSPPPSVGEGQGAGVIAIDDFAKVDLRIARIVKAEHVEGADKLLRLTVDLGELGQRTVFAGIKSAYAPEQLEGRLTVVVANLAPRKMKFGLSEGMVLAAGPGGKDLFILSPDTGAQPGMRVK